MILSQILNNILEYAQQFIFSKTNFSYNFSISPLYSQIETDVYRKASQLCGLINCSLVLDTTAAAIAYGDEHREVFSGIDGNNRLFIISGNSYTNMSVFNFSKVKLHNILQNVIKCVYSFSTDKVSGFKFSEIIYNYLVGKIKEFNNTDLTEKDKYILLKYSSTIKHQLNDYVCIGVEASYARYFNNTPFSFPAQDIFELFLDFTGFTELQNEFQNITTMFGQLNSILIGGNMNLLFFLDYIKQFLNEIELMDVENRYISKGCSLYKDYSEKFKIIEYGKMKSQSKN